MKIWNVKTTYRAKVGRNTTFKDIEETIETDDILEWVRSNRIASGFRYHFGKDNRWLVSAKEVVSDDVSTYLELRVENKDLFGGDFVLRKIDKNAIAKAQAEVDSAYKLLQNAYAGVVVG